MRKHLYLLIVLLSFSLSNICLAHKDAIMHLADFLGVLNGYGDDAFKELCSTISSGIDTQLPNAFREQLGSLPGNHRILGHGWALNDDIPRETLDALVKSYPRREKEIIKLWSKFASHLNIVSI